MVVNKEQLFLLRTLPVVTAKYGAEKVRVASMAAISMPDTGVAIA